MPDGLSDTLIFYIISTAASITVVVLGIIYKSKCKVITCCGCLRVERDVEAEERIDEMEITNKQPQSNQHNFEDLNNHYDLSDMENNYREDSRNMSFDPRKPRHYNQIANGPSQPPNQSNVNI
jgi:hypothetical protein